jgi:hypothetical protein
VVVAAHAVGDNRGEQAFDCGQKSDGKDGRQERKNVFRVELRRREMGEALRDSSELAADGFNRKVKERNRCRRQEQRDDGAGDPSRDARSEKNDGQ